MSVAVSARGEQSTQPFQCLICRSRFTRHENLKRHTALHTRSSDKASYSCGLCSATFSRRDLCTRHMRRKHPEHDEAPTLERSRPQPAAIPGRSRRKRSQDVASILGSSAESRSTLCSGQWRSEMHLDMSGSSWPPELSGAAEDTYRPNYSLDSPNSSTGTTGEHTNTDEGDMTFEVGHVQPSLSSSSSSSAITSAHLPSFTRCFTDMGLSTSPVMPALDFSLLELDLPAAAAVEAWKTPLSPRDLQFLQDEWSPSASQIEHGLRLYFNYVSPFFPFLHHPTFDTTGRPRYLILSMLSLGYQHGGDPDCGEGSCSGPSVSLHCFHQARVQLASMEGKNDDSNDGMAMVQAYLLLEICAMMYLCGENSTYGLKMHPRMISLTRSSGLTQPTRPSSQPAKDLQEMWEDFIRSESQKRTVLAAHQIDALWYQLLSIPRSLSHLEIKLELPCPSDCWAASSAESWAYCQLMTRCPSTSVQYSDAVRHFLSPAPDADPLPPFDPYGAINIAQFLLSSAREVSGWSAMTGRLSLERLEPLRSSLVALAPSIRPQVESADSPLAALQEATWEIAMIELQIWSPSHTCGIIEGSVDAALRESTRLAATGEISFGTKTAEAAQPHLDWFLRYLDITTTPDAEPPWTALYAYKAFLIAWQLLRKQAPNAMQTVGVEDGDAEAAISWARNVFQRRSGRSIGKIIMTCLDILVAGNTDHA
ncbi:hypothetical protein M406DRAFT_348099 [Cryphonectria parasitica EP155]|uniref:C2H2-type domain-containing protein n=1 Tax=Cryphonectria parasitica (strain ATCC 38755 / EP155) TaxID=660469 RepID=A0A9P4XWC6_CRYP1|nr:uncharacterized protein M406DRAFT_348099 [Cryphonectria parasitica EP155]KAF3762027.1 hypothetical protein M406DRAFT_348099 [Cryphonectria parasitica EP155]